ncbi:hypothetical protein AAHE18_13G394600 [Arachis hypogaea]
MELIRWCMYFFSIITSPTTLYIFRFMRMSMTALLPSRFYLHGWFTEGLGNFWDQEYWQKYRVPKWCEKGSIVCSWENTVDTVELWFILKWIRAWYCASIHIEL